MASIVSGVKVKVSSLKQRHFAEVCKKAAGFSIGSRLMLVTFELRKLAAVPRNKWEAGNHVIFKYNGKYSSIFKIDKVKHYASALRALIKEVEDTHANEDKKEIVYGEISSRHPMPRDEALVECGWTEYQLVFVSGCPWHWLSPSMS